MILNSRTSRIKWAEVHLKKMAIYLHKVKRLISRLYNFHNSSQILCTRLEFHDLYIYTLIHNILEFLGYQSLSNREFEIGSVERTWMKLKTTTIFTLRLWIYTWYLFRRKSEMVPVVRYSLQLHVTITRNHVFPRDLLKIRKRFPRNVITATVRLAFNKASFWHFLHCTRDELLFPSSFFAVSFIHFSWKKKIIDRTCNEWSED